MIPAGPGRVVVGWWWRNARGIALGAVVFAVLTSGALAALTGGQLRYVDEQEYLGLARSLVSGEGYALRGEPTAYRPPGMVFLLAPVVLLTGGSILAMKVVGVAALAATVWLTFLLATRVHSATTGALAAVMVACYPLFLYAATTLYPQIPATALLLAFVEASLRVVEARAGARWRPVLGAGAAGGLLVLTVPTFAPTLPAILLVVAWTSRHAEHAKAAQRALAAVLAIIVLLPSAWTVRNALVMHAFVPVSSNTGINLLLGNSENTTATSGSATDIWADIDHTLEHGMNEIEAGAYFRDRALGWVADHPGQAAQLYGAKLLHAFAYSEDLYTENQESGLQDLVTALTFYPVLLLVALRLVLTRVRPLRAEEKLMLSLVVGNLLLLAAFFVRIRLRLPLDAFLIILAASAVTHLACRPWRRSPAVASAR